MARDRNYALESAASTRRIAAPRLPYRPPQVERYRPKIGLIGCGGISTKHLAAYKAAGYDVAALCSRHIENARRRQKEFYPSAQLYTDYRKLLARDDIEVVDITPHPQQRAPVIKAAIEAGKHILSQKPFVTDLDLGQRLVDLADRRGVLLAVNQNARWAPNFAYLRAAIERGLIGQPLACHMGVHWDHNWVSDTAFNRVRHLVLYDFAIHWFDLLTCFMGDKTPRRVYASAAVSPSQKARPPLLAQALVEYDDAQATLVFDADVRFGPEYGAMVTGTKATIVSRGTSINDQTVRLYTAKGIARPRLVGGWFPDGFHGTMAELLQGVEQKRQPSNSARSNLKSLALCFAACASADAHKPMVPGRVRRVPA